MEVVEQIGEDYNGVVVVYTMKAPDQLYVDFHAADIEATECFENGVHKGLGFQAPRANSNMELVYDPREAEPYVHGSVKWDGCVNYVVGTEDVMMHACGTHDLARLSHVLLTIYERCGALMAEQGVNVLDGQFMIKPADTRR